MACRTRKPKPPIMVAPIHSAARVRKPRCAELTAITMVMELESSRKVMIEAVMMLSVLNG